MFPVMYSPNEPEHFLGFFTSWIQIRICPCGSGSRRHIFMRIRADPDPKHWYRYVLTSFTPGGLKIQWSNGSTDVAGAIGKISKPFRTDFI